VTRRDGFAPIEDYALIGNKRTAALVAADGAIDWWCPQRFDAPSAFGAILDPAGGGRFTLMPDAPFTVDRAYVPGTNVLETTFATEDGVARVTDAMTLPITGALDYNQIVRRVDGIDGEVAMRWRVHPRFGYGRRDGSCSTREHVALFEDGDLVLALQSHRAGDVVVDGDAATGAFACAEGDVAVLAVSSFDVGPVALADRGALLARLDATVEHWRRWSCGVCGDGRWDAARLRAALVLDLMVDAETGAIVAAPTVGLPERLGGDRNYDYRYAWLRDSNLTLEAMLSLGLDDQVHASLRWTFEALRHAHPRLRPIHRLDGRGTMQDEPLDVPGYRGSAPVVVGNAAQDQLQLGCYGDVLDMVWRYVEAGNALTAGAARRLAELADYVCAVWDRPDAGIWELRDAQHYTHSKLACHLALSRAIALAERGHLAGDVPAWVAAAEAIARFVEERCWDESRQTYVRAAESDELDAAVLLAARGPLLGDRTQRLSRTIDAVWDELGAGGPLLYRFSGMRECEGAFVACSFWAAEALARCGRAGEAEDLLAALADRANDVGLYAEEIDPDTGSFLGNFPQALSHLALVRATAVVARSRRRASARNEPGAGRPEP
jgi:GH15 family glucan-1,4-alpha-glucosidase